MASSLDTTATETDLVPGTPDTAEPTLRDDLDAAFREHATDEVDDTPAGDRVRDEHGRFARTPDGTPAKAAPGPQGTPRADATGITPATPARTAQAPIQPAPTPELKAPASWTPTAREKWASVDPEIRSEVVRRESEAQRVLQESAGLREFARSFSDVVRPYEMFIRAENSDPLRAVQALMNTAAELRVGSPQAKCQIVASIVKQHGIDLTMLDNMLAASLGVTQPGQPVPQQPQQPLRDPRLDQLLYQQQQDAAAREAWEDSAIRDGLSGFAQTHEFYTDVSDTMADLVDAATRRGQRIDLEAIYTRACQLDPEVSKIVSQREATAQPTQHQQRGAPGPSPAVLRARRAAVSVKGVSTPDGATVPKNDTMRASIEAAIDAHAE